ncbi:hypothetical protein CEXT_310641 [Caerostris extrusa]|uniref:Uncharacterized protein n=1 Tax=Caerostris extrusa TaxID=172846 RepID=A0AAV4U0B3_CAEEX|nr:hypothetical protein CEXT_310641 [Caerostris extrusa]
MAPLGLELETCGTERQSASHSAIQAPLGKRKHLDHETLRIKGDPLDKEEIEYLNEGIEFSRLLRDFRKKKNVTRAYIRQFSVQDEKLELRFTSTLQNKVHFSFRPDGQLANSLAFDITDFR